LAEVRTRLGSVEAELELRSGQVTSLTGQLEQATAEKSQLEQQVDSITSLLEASEGKEPEAATTQVPGDGAHVQPYRPLLLLPSCFGINRYATC